MQDATLSCIPCVRTDVKSIPHKAAFLGHLLLKNFMIFLHSCITNTLSFSPPVPHIRS